MMILYYLKILNCPLKKHRYFSNTSYKNKKYEEQQRNKSFSEQRASMILEWGLDEDAIREIRRKKAKYARQRERAELEAKKRQEEAEAARLLEIQKQKEQELLLAIEKKKQEENLKLALKLERKRQIEFNRLPIQEKRRVLLKTKYWANRRKGWNTDIAKKEPKTPDLLFLKKQNIQPVTPPIVFQKKEKIRYRQPKKYKYSAINADLDLSLPRSVLDSKRFQKNMQKVVNRVDRAWAAGAFGSSKELYEQALKNANILFMQNEKQRRLEKIILKDKKFVKESAQVREKRLYFDRRKGKQLLNNLVFKNLNSLLKIEKKKDQIKALLKKKKINYQPARFNFAHDLVLSSTASNFEYVTKNGTVLNVPRYVLFFVFSGFFAEFKKAKKAKKRRMLYRVRKDSEYTVNHFSQQNIMKKYFEKHKTKFPFNWITKLGALKHSNFNSHQLKLFNGPKPRISTKAVQKIMNFKFSYNKLYENRDWFKLNRLFWYFLRNKFCFDHISKLKILKKKTKSFSDFISIMESRLSTVLLRSLCPNAKITKWLILNGFVLINDKPVTNVNYVLKPLDYISLDSLRFWKTGSRFLMFLVYKSRLWFQNGMKRYWKFRVYEQKIDCPKVSCSHLMESRDGFSLIFLNNPYYLNLPRLTFGLPTFSFYSLMYRLV